MWVCVYEAYGSILSFPAPSHSHDANQSGGWKSEVCLVRNNVINVTTCLPDGDYFCTWVRNYTRVQFYNFYYVHWIHQRNYTTTSQALLYYCWRWIIIIITGLTGWRGWSHWTNSMLLLFFLFTIIFHFENCFKTCIFRGNELIILNYANLSWLPENYGTLIFSMQMWYLLLD